MGAIARSARFTVRVITRPGICMYGYALAIVTRIWRLHGRWRYEWEVQGRWSYVHHSGYGLAGNVLTTVHITANVLTRRILAPFSRHVWYCMCVFRIDFLV